ncbi:MAG: urease accessory protein UreF [Gammaproteobacteria bacterium]
MITDLALLRLLQLASPGLPIGMYSYSQGLETAVEDGWIRDFEMAGSWIAAVMHRCQARVDLPILARLHDAWTEGDKAEAGYWNSLLLACRETAELKAEDVQTGRALAQLLAKLEPESAADLIDAGPVALASAFGFAAARWNIPKREAMTGYLWSWLENQVLCAVKLVPLGQVAGQRLLMALAAEIPVQVGSALALADDDIGGSLFGLPLASCRHEMQYSRLFRS